MSTSSIRELKYAADIREVWHCLGGGELRHNRGVAFWRKNADGFNVSLDPRRGLWHDFVSGEGGDVVALVETVQRCSFREAAEWLAGHVGVTIQTSASGAVPQGTVSDRQVRKQREHDLRWAGYWRIAAVSFAERALEELSDMHPERLGLTSLLNAIRRGEESMLIEYRSWAKRCPQLTYALAREGRCARARLQRRLANWIMEHGDRG
jgi:hypothetical protein